MTGIWLFYGNRALNRENGLGVQGKIMLNIVETGSFRVISKGKILEENIVALEKDGELLRDKRLVFYEEDIDRINKVLEEFLKLSGSKSNLLVDKDGYLITKAGHTASYDLPTVSALVAGSFAATREMARLLGEEEFSVLFHQGKRDNVQLTLIGERTILATLFDNRTTIGMVRLYTKEAAAKLVKLFREAQSRQGAPGKEAIGEKFSEEAKGRLDDFFG
jgi:predicted regulator of Ras-like GTPase activity (Roadblock/LC7/MglB family)